MGFEFTNHPGIKVLDHGYVELVEAWGHGMSGEAAAFNEAIGVVRQDHEVGIVEAARQSTQGNFRGWGPDGKLLRHLFISEPQHATPFEFAGMVIEVQAPIMVFREWHRHRTQSYNEMSARYSPLPDLSYRPTVDRCHPTETANKQAQGSGKIPTDQQIELWLTCLDQTYKQIEACYQLGLSWGIPKELARLPVAVGRYSRMRASANLRNWLGFLLLRLDSRAQWEIRQYAEAVSTIVAETFPQTWALFLEKFPGLARRDG